MINTKKERKTVEWERLEISSRKSDIKGTFHTKMGTKKDKKSMDLTEAEVIKKRWQEYMEELYKKEIEESNRMGKTTDLGKKIRDTKETVHVKMDKIKDRSLDLTEAEDIKKRQQEYTE